MNVLPQAAATGSTTDTAADAAAESAAFIEALAEQLPAAQLVLDLDRNVRWATSTAAHWLGFEPGRLVGAAWSRAAPGWSRADDAIGHVLAGGTARLPRVVLAGLDGVQRSCGARLAPFFEAGQFTGVLVAIEPAPDSGGLDALPWTMTVGLWDLDLETGTISWQSDWCALHGLDPCADPGGVQRWNAGVHPDDRVRLHCRFEAAGSSMAECFRAEYRIRGIDGRWHWLHSRARVARRGANGAPRALTGFCMDIDRMKAAESEREQSRQIAELTLEGARAGLWTWDPVNEVGEQSDFLYRLLGVTPAEGRQDRLFWNHRSHPEDGPAFLRESQRLIAGDIELLDREHRMRHSDGSWRTLIIRSRAVERDVQGRARLVAGIVLDITERVMDQQAIRRSAALFQAAAKLVSMFVFESELIDGIETKLSVSQAEDFERIFGCDFAEYQRRGGWPQFVEPDDASASYTRRDRVFGGEPTFGEARIRNARGELRWLAIYSQPVIDPASGRVLRSIGAIHDITERKLLEREVLESAAREQQRIGSDLHDGLGQDLTGIAMLLRSVARDLGGDDTPARREVEAVIGLVNGAIENARTLARGLSPVSSGAGGLCGALQQLADDLATRRGVEVRLENPAACASCNLDESAATHLYRIAQEATHNALRHGRASRVTLELDCSPRRFLLRVTDNGTGLQPGATATSGMGLRTMRYRANLLQGDLTLRNGPAAGVIVECSGPIPL